MDEHNILVENLLKEVRETQQQGFTFSVGNSSSCRFTDDNRKTRPSQYASSLTNILLFNTTGEISFVDTEPGVSMNTLLNFTIKLDSIPQVLTEFKHMTIGGAIIGLGGESSSFRYGLIHEQVMEYDIIGEDCVNRTVRPGDELFHAIPGSYGAFGLITRIRIKCVPCMSYVKCIHKRVGRDELMDTMWNDNETIDYVDAIALNASEFVVVKGKMCPESTTTSFDKSFSPFYFNYLKRVENNAEIVMTIQDYIFRWDRGAFFNAALRLGDQDNVLTRMYMGSDLSCENLYKRARRRPLLETESKKVNHDMMIPVDTFFTFFDENVRTHNSFPMWLLPIHNLSDNLFGLRGRNTRYIDVGAYGHCKQPYDFVAEKRNLDSMLHRHGGYKCLWNQSYYSQDEFWSVYDKNLYDKLRGGKKTFGCIYDKTCGLYRSFTEPDMKEHHERVKLVSGQVLSSVGKPITIQKRKTAHFQMNAGGYKDETFKVDVSMLSEIVHVDPVHKHALVEPGVTIYQLFKELQRYNMMPCVVPELKCLTIGGLIQGSGLESSSFKHGQFNDTCVEYEVILGNGEIVTCSATERSDLFYSMSGSFGSLGILTLVKIKIQAAAPFVTLTYNRYHDMQDAVDSLVKPGFGTDFVEGIVFGQTNTVVISGKLADRDTVIPMLDLLSWNAEWFAEHVEANISMQTEQVSLEEYLFRHDRGAFWMGQYARFKGVEIGKMKNIRKLLYPYFDTMTLWSKLHEKPHEIRENRFFIQDCYIDHKCTADFVTKSLKRLGIVPLWLCPVKATRTRQLFAPHMQDTSIVIDVGIYGIPQTFSSPFDGISVNREIERWMMNVQGKKMFYGRAYYSYEELLKVYNHDTEYRQLRNKYHAVDRFLTIYEKILLLDK